MCSHFFDAEGGLIDSGHRWTTKGFSLGKPGHHDPHFFLKNGLEVTRENWAKIHSENKAKKNSSDGWEVLGGIEMGKRQLAVLFAVFWSKMERAVRSQTAVW
jgi:hypothetical protein